MNTSKDIGYLQHGHRTNGPFRTEGVHIRLREWPNAGQWEALFEGKWRVVHMQMKRLFIVYRGERITIQIEGV